MQLRAPNAARGASSSELTNGERRVSPSRSYFTQSMSLLGRIKDVNPNGVQFNLTCRSGDVFLIDVATRGLSASGGSRPRGRSR